MQLRYAVLFAIVLLMMAIGSNNDSFGRDMTRDFDKIDDFTWMEFGKKMVREKLKDPDSAKFRNVFLYRSPNKVPVACGEVNSKNSFGGYTGFQRFLSSGTVYATFLESEVSDFGRAWSKYCGR